MSETDKECQSIYLKGRKEMKIDGVKDVESFDESLLILQSTEGEITIEGNDLKVEVLDIDKGIVELKGRIDSIFYSNEDKKTKKSMWNRNKN